MTATPADIPSDLTLEIGRNLSPEKFVATVRAFFGYVREVSKTLAKGTRQLLMCLRHTRAGMKMGYG